jgi:hypothetical protein
MNCQIQPDIHALSISSKGIDADAIIIISSPKAEGGGITFPYSDGSLSMIEFRDELTKHFSHHLSTPITFRSWRHERG